RPSPSRDRSPSLSRSPDPELTEKRQDGVGPQKAQKAQTLGLQKRRVVCAQAAHLGSAVRRIELGVLCGEKPGVSAPSPLAAACSQARWTSSDSSRPTRLQAGSYLRQPGDCFI